MNVSQNDTKKKIRDTALRLFSEKGYDGVSVQDIAEGVGIKAPSLYKHYRSKKEIFMGIIEDAEQRYVNFVNTIRLDTDHGDVTFSPELLERKLVSYVSFAIHDEEFSSLRKLLTIEQYSLPEAAELLDRIYVKSLFSYHTALFTRLREDGRMQCDDPEAMAVMYGSPIIVMISECDRTPEREGEIMALLSRHVRQFYAINQREA